MLAKVMKTKMKALGREIKRSEAARIKRKARSKRDEMQRLYALAAQLDGSPVKSKDTWKAINGRTTNPGKAPDSWAYAKGSNIWCPIWLGNPDRFGIRQVRVKGGEPSESYVTVPVDQFHKAIGAMAALANKLSDTSQAADPYRAELYRAFGELLAKVPKQAHAKAVSTMATEDAIAEAMATEAPADEDVSTSVTRK